MKKVFLFLSIFLCILFTYKLNAKEENLYVEKVNVIEFESLNSKKINELFDGLDGAIIEIEISIRNITKTYRVNTLMSLNLEKELTRKVVENLEKEGLRELAVEAGVKGYKINKIKLICTNEVMNIIKERSKNV